MNLISMGWPRSRMEGWSVSDRMSGNCITREETMESAVRALILTTGLRLMAGNVRGMILRWISSWERSLLTMVWMEVEGPSPMWSMARAMNVVERRQSMAENLVQKSWVVEGSVVNWNCSTRSSAMRMQVAPVSGVQAKETRWAPGCIMRTSSRGVGVVERWGQPKRHGRRPRARRLLSSSVSSPMVWAHAG